MIRVAMLSFWHVHAKDYARQATEHPDTEIVALWDEIPERGKEEAEKRGAVFYSSLDELLSQSNIDGVIIDTPTTMHREVMIKAANAGKHIFTEKVIAATLKEVNEILSAVVKAGVKLTVSLPRLYEGYTQTIQQLLQSKLLGELTLVRTRLSHGGAIANWLPEHFYNMEETAGGAMIDLGCHPMYLARLFFGQMPERLSAHYGYVTDREVEDNATVVLSYSNGALGMVEAGFVNARSPFTIEIHGTEGSLMFGTPDQKIMVSSTQYGEEKEWKTVEIEPSLPTAFEQWVQHIQQNTMATDNIQMAVDLTRLMEAANQSAQEHKSIEFRGYLNEAKQTGRFAESDSI